MALVHADLLDADLAARGVHGEHAALLAAVGTGDDLDQVALANVKRHKTSSQRAA
jgi:hypothetical protein